MKAIPVINGMKVCALCRQNKPLSDYAIRSRNYGGTRKTIYFRCRPCQRAKMKEWHAKNPEYRRMQNTPYQRKWREANPEKVKAYSDNRFDKRREYNLLKKYNLTIDQYNQMFQDQGRACAICKSPTANAGRYGWHVDHCHETETVRGILCHGCNIGIGNLRHRPDVLRAAAEYLEAFQ